MFDFKRCYKQIFVSYCWKWAPILWMQLQINYGLSQPCIESGLDLTCSNASIQEMDEMQWKERKGIVDSSRSFWKARRTKKFSNVNQIRRAQKPTWIASTKQILTFCSSWDQRLTCNSKLICETAIPGCDLHVVRSLEHVLVIHVTEKMLSFCTIHVLVT